MESMEKTEKMERQKEISKKLGKLFEALLNLLYVVIVSSAYLFLANVIPWFIVPNTVIPTVGLIFIIATALYWYSGKGSRYMCTWPTLSIIVCILLGAFAKLAS